MKQKLIFAGAFVILAGTVTNSLYNFYEEKIVPIQPVSYNHKKHLTLKIDCSACHMGSREGDKAGIPGVEVCSLCHIQGRELPNTPPELLGFIQEKKEIPWEQIHKLPDHVKFSHRMHVSIAKLDCKECHGDMNEKEKAVTKQAIPVTMDNCVKCHRAKQVTTDCLGCHR